MSREREDQEALSTGATPFSDGFDEEGGQGTVEVIHGVYSHSMPLAGATVGEARRELEERMNIDPQAAAVVDGQTVPDDVVLREGQLLNFIRPAGERGAA